MLNKRKKERRSKSALRGGAEQPENLPAKPRPGQSSTRGSAFFLSYLTRRFNSISPEHLLHVSVGLHIQILNVLTALTLTFANSTRAHWTGVSVFFLFFPATTPTGGAGGGIAQPAPATAQESFQVFTIPSSLFPCYFLGVIIRT